ncbi:FAD-dependent oxidoreductase [Granulicella sibirica]|uniref:Thioredoxin reductase n=1 Tax=Granulicella sibirica TaxID=2479048 RepID=A0A4Q0T0P1_9BACT|nr:cyclic nucleotide-binding domain-containing thioredoxin-disulfide reductase [Granulicella sibirica]RXH55389.1 Thioredoxin reductase [Granulicella sibirica]
MISAGDLVKVPLFDCLSESQRERLAANVAELNVEAGEWIIREGETPSFLVLLEGAVDVEKEYGGASKVRGSYKPGDFYGETPILLDAPTIASLRATEPSRLVRLDRNQFKELIDSSPKCTNLVVQTMTKRLASIREYMRENNPLRVLVVGSQYNDDCREIRAFLALNRIPYEWVDGEKDPDRIPVDRPARAGGAFVVVDNSVFVHDPLTVRKVADALGIATKPHRTEYDVVVIGGGPAGLAAAVYGASEGLNVLLVEKNATGGQAGTSSRIENYLGFPNGISGDELASRALKQATRFGADIVMTRRVETFSPCASGYTVSLEGDLKIDTKAIVIATGVQWRRLQAKGLEEFTGKGVLYGAARTEAPTVVGKHVFIVGGGNSAGQAAMFFSSYAKAVTLLIRGAGLESSMSQYLIDQLARRANISVEANTQVAAVGGGECLLTIQTTQAGVTQEREAGALFVMIGANADAKWLPRELQRDSKGFICTGRDLRSFPSDRAPYSLETSLPGVFCVGDVRADSIKRVSSAVGEGSMAIAFIHQFLAC